jgi:hypothetical protein
MEKVNSGIGREPCKHPTPSIVLGFDGPYCRICGTLIGHPPAVSPSEPTSEGVPALNQGNSVDSGSGRPSPCAEDSAPGVI